MSARRLLLVCGVMMAAVLSCRQASALMLEDFISVSDPAESLFFQFCVIAGPGLPNAPQAEIDQLDLGLAVTLVSGKLYFEFVNASPINSAITDIYFDDSTSRGGSALIGGGSVYATEGTKVQFSVGPGSPPNLPGGQNENPAFVANTALSAHAANPSSKWGLNRDENLVLAYNPLVDSSLIADALLNGTLRVGLHVQSIGNSGQSDAFIAKPFLFPPTPEDPQAPVPEPATLVLLGMGGSLMALRRGLARNG